MNNRGDFFIGNKRVSSATGQERTFDAPIPTVTGEDPSRLSVIFDEVIVKERLVVEGGKSRTILTQFDGPVTFNEVVKVNAALTVNDLIKLNGNFEITNDTNSHSRDTGSLITDGGIGIEKNLNVGENFNALGISTVNNLRVTGLSTFTGLMDIDGGAEIGNFKVGITTANMLGSTSGNIIIDSAGGTTTIQDNVVVSGDFSSSGATNGNIKIGVTNDNEIDTSSGNLTIDSQGGTVTIDDNLTVNGNIDHTGVADFDNIFLDGSKIDTRSGNLILDSATGTTTVQDNLSVTGNQTVSGTLDVDGTTQLDGLNVDGTTTLDATTIAGTLSISGQLNIDNLRLDGNVISSTNSNGSISLLPNGSGDVVIGDGTDNDLQVKGDVIAFHSSDIKLKENITRIPDALDKISSLSGNTYTWIEGHKYEGQDDTGVIAQEVEALGLPGLTTTREDGTKGVRYEKLIPVLIEAIKELKAEIDILKK